MAFHLEYLNITDIPCTQDEVWCSLVCLGKVDGSVLDEFVLTQLGHMIEALWLTHWQCTASSSDWCTAAAVARLQYSPTVTLNNTPIVVDPPAESGPSG